MRKFIETIKKYCKNNYVLYGFVICILAVIMFIGFKINSVLNNVDRVAEVAEQSHMDMETVIATGIGSIKQRSKLVVMEMKASASASSEYSYALMTAKRNDTEYRDIQYQVDLSMLSPQMVMVTDTTIVINLPKKMINYELGSYGRRETHDNGSLLLHSGDVVRDLKAKNDKYLKEAIAKQATESMGIAEQLAVAELEKLFNTVIVINGYKIIVQFT